MNMPLPWRSCGQIIRLEAGLAWTGGNAIGKMCVDAWFGMMLPNADAQTQGMWFAIAPGAEVGFRTKSGTSLRVGTQLSFNFVRVHSDDSFDSMNLLSDREGAAVLGWLLSLGVDWQLF